MRIRPQSAVAAIFWFVVGFAAGVLFQKYYTADMLLRDLGLRTQLTDQLHGRAPTTVSASRLSNAMVAIAFGQSNAANYGKVRHAAVPGSYNFFAGKLYPARDPMIGADGMGGSVWTRLADRLIGQSLYDTVVFATLGVGASEIARWAPGGDLHPELLRVVDELKRSGLTITHLLWHQGERDAQRRTDPNTYKRLFLSMLQSLRQRGVTAPIYVSVATRCYENKGTQELRSAQLELPDPGLKILQGPDTDVLGAEYRYDGCHLSGRGLDAAANLWFSALAEH